MVKLTSWSNVAYLREVARSPLPPPRRFSRAEGRRGGKAQSTGVAQSAGLHEVAQSPLPPPPFDWMVKLTGRSNVAYLHEAARSPARTGAGGCASDWTGGW